ncbi:MAG: hypothetical protein KGL35_23065 [Bradyrhizobium sp.]|uniref:hypothetical protein n=1 Tax=Bradyrhizobium sp. TaxID=376 RepID=UPI001C295AF2|nr:hypothetical protein [Bradyrhizobium sp.]MBU6461248.1 hypothetical protein [Pseudomonadota bacterium]MDE2471527.1 hypothetical protein [Bradyrhizobium sp.]
MPNDGAAPVADDRRLMIVSGIGFATGYAVREMIFHRRGRRRLPLSSDARGPHDPSGKQRHTHEEKKSVVSSGVNSQLLRILRLDRCTVSEQDHFKQSMNGQGRLRTLLLGRL